MIKSIYFDMDGVLANFDKYMENVLGYAMSHAEDTVIKNTLTENIKNGFFANLEPMGDFQVMKELMKSLKNNGYEVLVLTAIGNTQFSHIVQQHKQEWLKKHGLAYYPSIFVHKSHEKAIYANSASLLIDDRDKSILPFAKRGGETIKHISVLDTIEHLYEYSCLDLDVKKDLERQLVSIV